MGEKNNALTVYMNRPDRIRSVLEYYLGDKLPPDWECREIRGFYTIRNTNGKLSARQRDFLGIAQAWGNRFLLGLEHQENIGLTFPWRLMEMTVCPTEMKSKRTSRKIPQTKSITVQKMISNTATEKAIRYHLC